MRLFSFLLLAGFLPCAAAAEAVRDDSTGLSIDPPEGYEVRTLPSTDQYAAIFEVKKPGDKDTGCRVAFQNAPTNASLSQEQINDQTSKEEWGKMVRSNLEKSYEVQDLNTFEHTGVKGAAIVGDIKPRAELPPRAQEVRTLLVILETPKGRTSTVCVGEKDDFANRRPEFEQVARATTLPK